MNLHNNAMTIIPECISSVLKNDSEQYGLDVQSVNDIRKRLKKQDAELRNYFSLSHWAKWEAVAYNINLILNLQSGNLTVTLLDGTTENMDYDTPDNLWIEWQMLNNLARNNYPGDWERDVLHSKAGFTDKFSRITPRRRP